MLGVPTALLCATLERSQQLRLGVVREFSLAKRIRPSPHRQSAGCDTRHDDRGLIVTVFAA